MAMNVSSPAIMHSTSDSDHEVVAAARILMMMWNSRMQHNGKVIPAPPPTHTEEEVVVAPSTRQPVATRSELLTILVKRMDELEVQLSNLEQKLDLDYTSTSSMVSDYEEELEMDDDDMRSELVTGLYTKNDELQVSLENLERNVEKVSKNVHKLKKDVDIMVPIGNGYAAVPAALYSKITWAPHTYTTATRKLLTAVFKPKILATHSLTGKPSPAFPDRPGKKKLNELLVDDIVQTVVEKCGVTENLVRNTITVKCADECKMLRNRQKKRCVEV